MKAIEKLKEKKDEIKTKIDDHSEQISNVLIAAGAGILVTTTLTTTAYVIGRWRGVKYLTGLMFLAREAGLMKFNPYEFLSFIDDHPQKEVFKDWKRICEMK